MTEMVSTGRTVEQAKDELRGILRMIRKLLDKAEGTDNPHEAESFRAHAEKLMRKYRIDQEQLLAADASAAEPIRIEIDLCGIRSKFFQQYANMMYAIAYHTGVRVRTAWVAPEAGASYVLRASVVGYEGDARYAEMLFTSAQLVFAERLEPAVRPELSDAENVYRLRSAGIERNRIANLLWGTSTGSDGAWAHRKVGNLYKEACAARGEDAAVSGRTVNASTYREVFAHQFTERLYDRLRAARNAADSAGGGALVLHGRKERVDEAFYKHFPELRPASEPLPTNGQPKPKSRKRKGWTEADQARYNRMNFSPSALAGTSAGRSAADEVEIREAGRGAKRLPEDSDRSTLREITGLEISE